MMFKKILQSKWFTAGLVAVVGFLTLSLVRFSPALNEAGKAIQNLDRKIADAKRSSLELEGLDKYLKSDVYLERQARLKLNYKKPDENVIYVYRKDTEAQQGPSEARKSNITKLLENLKNWWQNLVSK